MKKFVLLASLMALAALMLAAAPAFAQTERVVVCHKEFGQGAAEFTLEIDRSALEAHLAHGDTLGPCEDDGDDGDDGDDNGDDNGDDDGDDNGDDNVVDITDRDVLRLGGDDININGGGGSEYDVNTDSTIDISPSLDVDGGGTINQTAIAESDTFLVKDHHPKTWWW